jgi:flavodoxin
MELKNTKCLIAYFSRKGNNYVGGRIVDLPVGNTESAAKLIQGMAGGDLFHIEAVNKYPEDYTEATHAAQKELRENARPRLTSSAGNLDPYEVIFLGYPNWWGTMPMPVFTFLEGYDFSGKTIVPFCTHEGSGLGRSVSDIKKLCPGSRVLDGLAIKGSIVNKAQNDITAWLHQLALTE